MPQPHHQPTWGRVLATLGTVLALYTIMGVITLEPTRNHLEARCQPTPRSVNHVALWPISVLALAGLPSRC